MVFNINFLHFLLRHTVEFRRLGQCFLDWAIAVVGEADRELTCVTLTYHSSGTIYETLSQSTEFDGKSLLLQMMLQNAWNSKLFL